MSTNVCYVCQDSDNVISSPCDCGANVHVECLAQWIAKKKTIKCSICGTVFLRFRGEGDPRIDENDVSRVTDVDDDDDDDDQSSDDESDIPNIFDQYDMPEDLYDHEESRASGYPEILPFLEDDDDDEPMEINDDVDIEKEWEETIQNFLAMEQRKKEERLRILREEVRRELLQGIEELRLHNSQNRAKENETPRRSWWRRLVCTSTPACK